MSASKIPAAAIGPGVGGTSVWDAVKPSANATAEADNVIFAFFERLLFRGDRRMKPLSAKTGIETNHPMIPMAEGTRFRPVMCSTFSAIL